MEINKLIDRLKDYKIYDDAYHGEVMVMAANALESQQKRIAELEKKLEVLCYEHEAAMQDIQDIARLGYVWMCPYCKHATSVGKGFADCDLSAGPTPCRMPYTEFKWRGAPKGDV